jgi:hypothetical protein
MFDNIAKYAGAPFHKLVPFPKEGSPDNKTNKKESQPTENLHSDVAAKHAKVPSNHVLESIRYWDVTMPPVKKYMLGGTLVPAFKNVLSEFSMGSLNKKRRITIELYKPTKSKDHRSQSHYQPHERRMFGTLLKGVSSLNLTDRPTLDDHDIVIFRILKARRLDSSDDDSETTGGTSNGDLDSRTISAVSLLADNEDVHEWKSLQWKERYRAKLQNMEILSSHGRTVDMRMGAGDDTVVRDLLFDNKHDAQTFITVFQELRQLQREAGLRLAISFGSTTAKPSRMIDRPSGMIDPPSPSGLESTPEEPENEDDHDEMEARGFAGKILAGGEKKQFPDNLCLLFEIVSASNLPIAGKPSRKGWRLFVDDTSCCLR